MLCGDNSGELEFNQLGCLGDVGGGGGGGGVVGSGGVVGGLGITYSCLVHGLSHILLLLLLFVPLTTSDNALDANLQLL